MSSLFYITSLSRQRDRKALEERRLETTHWLPESFFIIHQRAYNLIHESQ